MARKQLLVTLIGTDGSGKTSTTDALSGLLNDSMCSSAQIWCGAESYLMKPFRFILKLIRRNNATPQSSEISYQSEIKEKHELGGKLRLLTSIYIWLVLIDYSMQYRWKMWRSRSARVLLLDRYFFDVAVNLAITLGWDEDQLISFIQNYCGRYKFPDVRSFIYVPPEVSMERKDDIPDISYVELRMKYYQAIADLYNFSVIDGQENIADNAAQLYETILAEMDTCYVHYVHSNNEDVGGADFCLFRMAEAVNNTANYRSAISLRLRTGMVRQYEKAGVPVYIGSYCRPQLSRGIAQLIFLPFKSVYSIWYFWLLFRSQQPDIVHVNDLYDFLPAIAAKLAGIPVVYHIRMIRTNKGEIKVFSWLLKNLSQISFSVSEAVHNTYFDPEKIEYDGHSAEVVYDWPDPKLVELDENSREPEEFTPYDTVVVMVGRIEWWKGQHVFLDALKRIKDKYPSVGFFLIGGMVKGASKERYAEEILNEANTLGVNYLGQRSDVVNLLTHADISIHCSVTPDPFPGVVLESLLSQSATIGADAGGVSEMIRHEQDGLKYQPGNAAELASCLDKLLSNKPLRLQYAASGRQRILDMANKDKIMSQTLKLYKSCEEKK